MRIAITGASGRVGQQLVPRLVSLGVQPVLLGRNPTALAAKFSGLEIRSITELSHLTDVDAVLHMASLNNDSDADLLAFREVNVDLTMRLLEASKIAGIPRFIFVSSTHALSTKPSTFYGITKREAAIKLMREGNIGVTVLHCAAIVGDKMHGKLRILDSFPRALRYSALKFAQALKPTLSIDRLCDTVAQLVQLPAAPNAEIVLTERQDNNQVYHTLKRSMDVTASLAVLILAGWAVVLAWIAVRRDSPGPGFFFQERVGKNGRTFHCVKMRTMTVDTPNAASHHVGSATITSVGRRLRESKLDEVPQIWNVLRGDMSFVGPRPCLPSQQDVIEARRLHGVLAVTPGITGLSQIQGVDMSEPELLARTDAQYRDLQSISEDVKIILNTIRGQGFGDAAKKAA